MAATRGLARPGAAHAPSMRLRRQAAAIGAPSWLAVGALAVAGAVLRVLIARQSVFADELSTYWISVRHSLGGVLSLLYSTGRIQHAEITPPLSFLTSWLTTRVGGTPELLRLPALLAGTATIPLIYRLGLETVGRRAALVAAALTTFAPFMIYYSAEARSYGLLMMFVTGAVLSTLLALRTGRAHYWILYALCAAATFYTHYTGLFVLGALMVWVLWTRPQARRSALLATGGAVILALPWIPGLVHDAQSPTVKILSALSPFTASAVRIDLEHWSIGYPYSIIGLRQLPGTGALILLGLSGLLTLAGLTWRARRRELARPSALLWLVFALMLATPACESLASAVGSHIIGTRDLAASWPFLALLGSALVVRAGRGLGLAAAALAVVAFAWGAVRMLEPRFQRPDYQGAADYVAAKATGSDVVIDMTGALSPGPLTGFDITFHRDLNVVRARTPAERDHPFTVFDPVVSTVAGARRAAALARGHRIFVVYPTLAATLLVDPIPTGLPGSYRLRSRRVFPGIEPTLVAVYSGPAGG
ncbi:MAG TPA: glycosyltransferase family 39 protein [Solirubrobacteraceae bacterium]